MPTDYEKLKADNIRRYGEDIGRIGPMLLAHRYDNRAHFIFELLQNAEDALRRRQTSNLPKSVRFHLKRDALTLTHLGDPFTPHDVQFICGIGESIQTHALNLTDIGRFGIGFKSVYAFTDSPEIHSGDEHFAIHDYVRPVGIAPTPAKDAETVFNFPFRDGDTTANGEIAGGLSSLSLSTLLFLREINEVEWIIEGGSSGTYLRKTEKIGPQIRKVTLYGQIRGRQKTDEETYLVFERPVTNQAKASGWVEIAFQLASTSSGGIQPVENATLAVFFPTIVPTRFGAILQGPFRTTPSRDNIPRDDPWNRYLVGEMAMLLADSLVGLKSLSLLDAAALNALPIHRARFPADELFRPIYDATIGVLKSHPLLPCVDGSRRCAAESRLGRTKEIRELFSPEQLGALLGEPAPVYWISDAVTRDKMTDLHQYLQCELGITEVGPEAIASRITEPILAAQPVEWIARFYEFLNKQESAWRFTDLREKPILRLSDGKHVAPFLHGHPQAFLPGGGETNFPTVHPEVCRSEGALEFLKRLGLAEPDPVDDVIVHLLPKYHADGFTPPDAEYSSDLARIHAAFGTDSTEKKKRLVEKLRETPFVPGTDAGTGDRRFVKPGEAYLPTERFKALFAGIRDIWIADIAKGSQKFEPQRDLLRACGAAEYLVQETVEPKFRWDELRDMRRKVGCENNTGNDQVADHTLRGVDGVLAHLATLSPDDARARSALLWEALCDVEDQRGTGVFSGKYSWFYYSPKSCSFDAAFIRKLREITWVPKPDGTLARPSDVVFEDLLPAWKENPFLLAKISFKPRAVAELAKTVGLEPGLLDLLKQRGITSEAQLRQLLGEPVEAEKSDPGEKKQKPTNPQDAISTLLGGAPGPSPAAGGVGNENAPGAGSSRGASNGGHAGSGLRSGSDGGRSGGGTAHSAFHTYVAVSLDDNPPDAEGLVIEERRQIEEVAIQFILSQEPSLKRTSTNNPGFDLFEGESLESVTRFVEVKSRKGPWSGPVALTSTQFRKAQAEGERFWLYVVENVADPASTRLHAIHDPATKARHYCFDHGWASLANPEV